MIKKILFFIIFLAIFASSLYAEETKETAEPIVVNGDKVQYDHANKMVTGIGNVSITYKDVKITCDKIVVDIDSREGVAEGAVTLYQENNVFKADKVLYNFEKKTGRLLNGDMKMPPWYGRAESIDKIDEKTFKLNKSYVTTCDFERPHYRIEAKTIKVYLGDRVTAWHVFFYADNIPVMYVPYYNHPLKDNLPQVDIVPGRNDEWGTYLLTAWRYYFHPDSKGHVHFDWRSKRGFGEGFDYKYGLRKFGNGYSRFYYIHDKEPDEGKGLGIEMPNNRWRVQLRHKWDVDENTFVAGEFHKLSDQDFIKDFFYKEEYEREEQPRSYLTLTGAKDNYSLSLLYDKKTNDFFTVTERLPEAKLNIRKLKLLNFLDLYYQNESSFAMLNRDYAKDTGRHERPGDDYDATRIDSYNELSYPFKLLGFLNVDPFAGTRQTFYTEDASGKDNIRYVFTTGADLYTRLYKIYDFETDFLNLDIHHIRHLIIPSVRYVYIRKPSLTPHELLQFDEIDNLDHENDAELSLQHKLQTKRGSDGGKMETVDLLTFIISSDYIFKDNIGGENELSNLIEYDLEIKPYSWMFIDADADFDRRERRFDIFNADLYIDRGDELKFGTGYRYERDENSQLTGSITYHINKDNWRRHWAFNIYERYEIQEKKFQEQEYTITKDLHCWFGELTCRIKDQKDFTFWLIFRLKAFPDVPFFFRTSYHGPEPGSKR